MTNTYTLNLETSKIELSFAKEDYLALSQEDKSSLKRAFLFSGRQKAWVSRSKNNHYNAIQTAEKLGFINGGKTGERLSFHEELEKQAGKAEARAERFEQYADNADKRANNMQSEFNELRKDWSWVTQPNVSSSKGRSFTNQREKVIARYEKGFEEYRKSEYFKKKAETARSTAEMSNLKSKPYLNNRIEEVNKRIRQLEKRMVNNESQSTLDEMEYQLDRLAFFHNCIDELGGISYSKENVKPNYLVKIRGHWNVVIKANPKTVQTKSNFSTLELKYPYAEIQDMKIPEDYQEPTPKTENNFKLGDILTYTAIASDRIINAFQVVKVSAKSVVIQEITVSEDNEPQTDDFKSDKQQRKAVKKDRSGNDVLNHGDWYLHRHRQTQNA